jgi:hypothetical protein
MPLPYIFTFYSYKGGVGRSLALLNTAYDLVSRGRHVLIIDMDLEAPGLSGFLQRHGELLPAVGPHPQDILSLLSLALDAVRRNVSATDLPPISNFIRSVRPEKLSSLDPKFGKLGRLDVIGAEQNDRYLDRLTNLGLKDIDQNQIVAVSALLSHYCKAQRFPVHPLGLEAPCPAVETPYDYVLIDSRTGFTEVGGLCLGPWADRLVVITGLNDQNVTGTKEFLRVVGLGARAPEESQPWDDADPTRLPLNEQPTLGPKPTILVASPVPLGETDQARLRLQLLQSELKLAPLSLSYHPLMALLERVFIRDYPDEFLTAGYKRLTSAVMHLVADHPDQLIRSALLSRNGDPSTKTAIALRAAAADEQTAKSLLPVLADHVTADFAEPDMQQLFAAWVKGATDRSTVLYRWAEALRSLGESKTGPEAIALLQRAGEKYQESATLDSAAPATLTSWGRLLMELAAHHTGAEAAKLLDRAEEKFEAATHRRPSAETYTAWGDATLARSRQGLPERADSREKSAIAKFRQALALSPSDGLAALKLGTLLAHTAESSPRTDQIRLLSEANKLFAIAAENRQGSPHAHIRMGNVLARLVALSAASEAPRLKQQATTQFTSALKYCSPEELFHVQSPREETAPLLAKALFNASVGEADSHRRSQLADAIGLLLNQFPSRDIALEQAMALYNATVDEPDPHRCSQLADAIALLLNEFPSQDIAILQAKALCNATYRETDLVRCAKLADAIGLILDKFPSQAIALQKAMALFNATVGEPDTGRCSQLADAIGLLLNQFPSQDLALQQAKALVNATVGEPDPRRCSQLADAIGLLLNQFPSQDIALEQAKALFNATFVETDPLRCSQLADAIGLLLSRFPAPEIAFAQAEALSNAAVIETNLQRSSQLADAISLLLKQFPTQDIAKAHLEVLMHLLSSTTDANTTTQLRKQACAVISAFDLPVDLELNETGG